MIHDNNPLYSFRKEIFEKQNIKYLVWPNYYSEFLYKSLCYVSIWEFIHSFDIHIPRPLYRNKLFKELINNFLKYNQVYEIEIDVSFDTFKNDYCITVHHYEIT